MIMVAQIRTGGVGINELVASAVAIYYSTSFSWIDFDQSKARLHRYGQEKVVTYYHLLMRGTVDEEVYTTIKSKQKVSELILTLKNRWEKACGDQ